jgi:hypothetical protein
MRSFFSTLFFAAAAVADVTIHMSGPSGEWAVVVPEADFDKQVNLSNRSMQHLNLALPLV